MEPGGITTALARRLVDGQFPQWSWLPIRAVARQGMDNRSFRLGDDLVVRLPAGEWYALQVAKEQMWLPRLGPLLPLPIPQPLAHGVPGCGYPYPWSIYRWIDGTTAAESVTDWRPIAEPLGRFLAALHHVDPRGGPEPGRHNFFRGAPVSVYAEETTAAIDTLSHEIARSGAHAVWAAATATHWTGPPRWFHGDVSADNLLTRATHRTVSRAG
ncbi:phosphotransferase [Candidatus Mycobacterium methanotrophicum]|uniref:Phosphotransferase n=1 Tax=Candidatus Mycobacterium methanotrophicum TaxID=2943498 RepID=A0ABY4QL13_9MYCO|nr:phosphotransferase [Candidatus Mycobacterium methanotrophicum]UQX10988.1 phosphotransferase [Candidatus Mycobacterium methanotrophicum]